MQNLTASILLYIYQAVINLRKAYLSPSYTDTKLEMSSIQEI